VLQSTGIEPAQVKAVSATSMREGIVAYDEAGHEIWACPNVDSRAVEEAGELVRSGLAERIFRLAGDWVSITSPARLLWIRKHEPGIFERIAHINMLSDWILFRLSGQYASDPSVGSSSGMFDLSRRTWSDEILDICGLRHDVFPQIKEPGTVIGAVTAAAARETGLAAGTPVVMGGADTQLGLLGIGMTRPNQFTVVGGSFWQATVVLDKPLVDPQARLRTLCHVIPGQWMMEGIGFYSGITLRWFRDAFCDLEKEQAAERGIDPYVLMEQSAATVPPGSNGVIGIFSNIMEAQRWVHASPAFLQFDIADPAHSGRRECIRAILESGAYVAGGHLGIIEELTGRHFDEAVFTGGAAKSRVWPQIMADVLGVPVRVPVVKESTALGAAICAGLGAGLYDDVAEVTDRIVRFEATYQPASEAVAAYRRLSAQWRDVYSRCLAISEDGLLRPLWRAAGT
jgi:autoinducer 2 (AI-2) kinase